MSYNISVISH